MKRLGMLGLFVLAAAGRISGLAVDEILASVDKALKEERYRQALELLESGKKEHPDAEELWIHSGDIYRDRKLYRLSYGEYKEALRRAPGDSEILYRLSRGAGYLNENEASAGYLEELLDIPEWRDRVVSDLGWMYYKNHRLDEGVRLLEGALAEKEELEWAVTLGTLYSGLYRYEKSRYWYQKAIDKALEQGNRYFASVVLYNQALLEMGFYNYDEAWEAAKESLQLRERAEGYLVQGELRFQAWDLPAALAAYRQGESLDETPLSRMDMAVLYRRIGRLKQALRLVQEVQSREDKSWMYYYGIDESLLQRNLDRVLADIWSGRARVEALTPGYGVFRRLVSWGKGLIWRGRSLFHDRRFRALSRRFAQAQAGEGSPLEAAWHSAQAAKGYPRQALAYLKEARMMEEAMSPRAAPWYDLEEGGEAGDVRQLLGALEAFLPEEGAPKERGYRELALLAKTPGNPFLGELYRLNPGGLRQYGLSLPLRLQVRGSHPGQTRRLHRRSRGLLRRGGHRVLGKETREVHGVITLRITPQGEFNWFVTDPQGVSKGSGKGKSLRSGDLAPVLALALDALYLTPLLESKRTE